MILKISLPDHGKTVVKVGQHVSLGDRFLKGAETKEVRIPVAELLFIKPRYIFRYMKKNIGDSVVKGDVLAEKKSLFSLKRYESEYSGVIKEIDHIDGIVLLEIIDEQDSEQRAFFTGEIVEIDKKEVHVKVGKGKEFEIKHITEDFGGELWYQKNDSHSVTEEDIQGKVYCCGSIHAYEQRKIEALGAVGIVSLHSLPEPSMIPFAKIPGLKDWDEVSEGRFPYCATNKRHSRIYFYFT